MYSLREICKAEPFERPLHRSFFFSAHFLFNFYDYDSLWVFMSESGVTSNVVDKFAWNGFCIVKIATCKTCAIILVVAKKQKPQNTELECIFNWNENRILANNSCAVIMCVFLLFMCRFLMMNIKVSMPSLGYALEWNIFILYRGLEMKMRHLLILSLCLYVFPFWIFFILLFTLYNVFFLLQQMLKLEFKRHKTNRHDIYETETERQCYKMQSTLSVYTHTHTVYEMLDIFVCCVLVCFVQLLCLMWIK